MAKKSSGGSGGAKIIAQSGNQNVAQSGEGTQKVTFNNSKRTMSERAKFFGVGVALLLLAGGLAVWGFALGTLTPDQRKILVWALPLASGFGCGSFAGGISAKGKELITGLIVTATGGFVVWLITVYVLFPTAK